MPLKYVFLSDRDFLTDEQLQQREVRARLEHRSLEHLQRRHRESYLLDPKVIARVVKAKWNAKNSGKPVPTDFSENGIKILF